MIYPGQAFSSLVNWVLWEATKKVKTNFMVGDTAFVLVDNSHESSVMIRLPNIGLVMFETDILDNVEDLVHAVSRELGGLAHTINIMSTGGCQL